MEYLKIGTPGHGRLLLCLDSSNWVYMEREMPVNGADTGA